jgi:fatty-acyl-CoA synthase
MKIKKLPVASQAFDYPLLIKSILAYSTKLEPNREIVYRDLVRYNYITLNQRVAQLANVLTSAGMDGAATVAVLDYDSHRYLECFLVFP